MTTTPTLAPPGLSAPGCHPALPNLSPTVFQAATAPPAHLPALPLSGPKRANVGPRSQSPEEQQGPRWGALPREREPSEPGPHLHRMHHGLGLLPRRAVATGGGRRQLGSRAGWALREWTASELRARPGWLLGAATGRPVAGRGPCIWTRARVGGNGG